MEVRVGVRGKEEDKEKEMERRQDQRQTRERGTGDFHLCIHCLFDLWIFTKTRTRTLSEEKFAYFDVNKDKVWQCSKLQALCDAAATQFTQKTERVRERRHRGQGAKVRGTKEKERLHISPPTPTVCLPAQPQPSEFSTGKRTKRKMRI